MNDYRIENQEAAKKIVNGLALYASVEKLERTKEKYKKEADRKIAEYANDQRNLAIVSDYYGILLLMLQQLIDYKKTGKEPKQYDIEILANNIINECSEFLQEINYDLVYKLFRGIPKLNSLYGKKHTRTDRRPMSNDYRTHEYFNLYFKRKYGVAFRSSVFATGRAAAAITYGTLVNIFPIGKFDYLWSPDITDLYGSVTKGKLIDFNIIAHDALSNTNSDNYVSKIDDYLSDVGVKFYHNTDLTDAILSCSEIMINCNSYYYIRHQLYTSLENTIKELLK